MINKYIKGNYGNGEEYINENMFYLLDSFDLQSVVEVI